MQPVTGCQDPCQSGSGERGGDTQVSIPPKDTPGSPAGSHSELGSSSPRAAVTFDLFNMVVSYRRMALFLEPLTDALELARYLLGWRMPLFSLLVCLILNILFLTLSEVGWFSVCVVGVSAPAALGYLQDRCGGGASEVEQQKRWRHTVQRRDLQNFHLTRQDAMMEVKHLLKQLDDLLSQACLSAESVYKVLYWDSHSTSSRFYGGMLTVLILLHYVPVGWLLVRCQYKHTQVSGQYKHTQVRGQYRHTQDLSPGSVEEAEEAEPDDEFKDAIEEDDDVPLGTPDFDAVSITSDNGLLSRNEPIRSKVSKLTEKLRKRYPTNNTGNCSSCASVFSVVKRRRSCSNCGNSFCSRCCSYKVLKSCMGATAPEAQRETVFVCAACNTALSK
uniref:Protrudin n=1 Tax=Esox lucius TaxID=8010 RepID=A0AAY5JX82_ESOLU